MGAGVSDDNKIIRVTDEISGDERRLVQGVVSYAFVGVLIPGLLLLPLLCYPFVHNVQISICEKGAD